MTQSYVLPFLLHSSTAGMMLWGFNSLQSLPITQAIDTQFGGHYQFLTILGLLISVFAMSLGALLDVFPDLPTIRTAKRGFLMVALPVEAVVFSIYWTLILFFPKLIIQMAESSADFDAEAMAKLGAQIPLSIDLALHGVPAVSLLTDFLLFERKFGKDVTRYAVAIVGACTAAYSAWAEYCASANGGTFPYPFLTENTFPIRVGIYAGASVVAYASFRLLNELHG